MASFLLSGLTVDCRDPVAVAGFWQALLGLPESEALPGWVRLGKRSATGPVLNFQPVPEGKSGKNRLHLDLTVDDVDDAVARVVALGGHETGERHEYDEGTVVVLTDPEGNEFCVVQYFADRSPEPD
jgi:predicted enzyme related to lactoylglutathione lyase